MVWDYPEERYRKPICTCENCGAEINKDDTCYRVSDTIFCDLCVEVLTGGDLKEDYSDGL